MKNLKTTGPVVIILSGILLILVLVFKTLTGPVALNYLKNQPIRENDKNVVTLDLEVETFLTYGDKWIISRNLEGISGKNLESGRTWKSKIYPPKNNVWTGSNGFAVMENGCITVFSFSGDKFWSDNIKHELINFFGPVNGFALIEQQSNKGNRVIAAGSKGNLLWEFPLNELKLITAGVSPDKNFLLSVLDLNNGMETKILKFNEKGELLWALSLGETVVPFLGIHEKGIAAIEANRIVFISPDGKITKEVTLKSIIKRAAFSEAGFIAVSFNKAAKNSILKADNQYVIELYDLKGSRKWGLELKTEVKGIEFGKEKPVIITYTDNEIFGISEQGGLLWEFQLEEKLEKIYVSREGLPAVLKTFQKLLLLDYEEE